LPTKKSNINKKSNTPVIRNKRGLFNYSIESSYEAGIVLTGGEVKSIRSSHMTIHESYGKIEKGEVWLYNLHIVKSVSDSSEWETLRKRKLLLHKREIRKITHLININPSSTIVPIKFFFQRGKIKVEIAIGIGKKKYDKRETIKKRDINRSLQEKLKKSITKFN
jgi:SsrA-binding protein|tara:strand:- start:4545 stop:5039 length:495 start_codon:yes stop_codon:yes gene_type:complete